MQSSEVAQAYLTQGAPPLMPLFVLISSLRVKQTTSHGYIILKGTVTLKTSCETNFFHRLLPQFVRLVHRQ